MISIVKIVHYKQENPTLTLADIGKQFGVSRQYIHKVLKQSDIPTKRVIQRFVNYCLVCGNSTPLKVCKGKGHFRYYNLLVNCSSCHIPFYRKRGQIINKHTRGYNKIYCSRRCYYRGKRQRLA